MCIRDSWYASQPVKTADIPTEPTPRVATADRAKYADPSIKVIELIRGSIGISQIKSVMLNLASDLLGPYLAS